MTNETEIGKEWNVVLPLEVQEWLEVKPGDKVMFIEVNGDFVITTRKRIAKRLRGAFATNDGRSLTDELLEERRQEAAKKWL